ncbi:sugar phosphate isomerase/epimerase (plasmid) [Enterococcus gilvus]|uniref:sugar phosphate isomerase/epimerase family protein n=1 Tax=Enterococcus gilvus TaxID=160453 RepID=UPI000DF62D4A|nr:TIM barrel protein [Enterococcus gilvus]AXG40572.1 sugar phosphate isomerase/epimerase [Enterococcus gilvus]MDN6690834.1 sugar phosphate isomerase/epimerase [Enterococcus sp.]
MRESIHKYFDMGLIQWMSYPPKDYPLLETLTKISRDPYFNAVEMTQVVDDDERKKARDILAQSHIRVCYGAQPRLLGPGLNPNAINEEERLKAEKTLLEAIDEAEYLGARGIAFLSGKWEAGTKEEAYQQLLKTTRNLCTYAAKKEMMVELEIFDYDMDKCALIGPAPLAAQFAADVCLTHNNFGLIVDLSHFPTTYETSKFVIQCTKPYITHLHIGNNVVTEGCEAYGDLHPRFGYPNSANDVPELLDFFQVLKQEGFLDEKSPMVLSFEVQPRPDEDGDIIVANTKRVIERAWALLED